MQVKRNRIYADTSVFGGVFDDEFAAFSRRFFDDVLSGKHIVLISQITLRELGRAPLRVRRLLRGLPPEYVETILIMREMIDLTNAYIAAKVVAHRWFDDAAHVAAATVSKADVIISWNLRHLVKWERIRAFNAVNLNLGYPMMTIFTPREVVNDEKEV